MKKRILCLGLALVLTSSCFACSKEKNPASKDDTITTEATENDLTTSDENTTTAEDVTTEVIDDVTEPSNEEEATTSDKETETPTEAPTIESLKNAEEIIECLVENQWYTEPRTGENDVLFYYQYYEMVFCADGTVSENVYRNLDEDKSFEIMKWSVTDDKKLEIYNEDDYVGYTWSEDVSRDRYSWYLTKDTLMINNGYEIEKYSIVKTEIPEFTDVYETDYNELKSQLVNNAWWTDRNMVYEFLDNGTLVGTGYDENGNKEITNGNWSLSSDCVLQINIDGSENKSFNLLTFEACKNREVNFGSSPYWWMTKNGNLRAINMINVWRLDENFSDTYMIRFYLSTYVEAFIKGFGDQRFYTEKLLSERDNGFFDEIFTTINNGKIKSCDYDGNNNIVVIVLENNQRFKFEVEIDKLTNKINNIKEVSTQKPTEKPSSTTYIVAKGCTYYDASAGSTLKTGDKFPDVVEDDDVYTTSDYKYTYISEYKGWTVEVIDKTKTTYGEILSSIAGICVMAMNDTFVGCENLTMAPVIPSGVKYMSRTFSGCRSLITAPEIPSGVINMNSTFAWCENLKTVPQIPSSVEYMMYTFCGCVSLITAPEISSGVINMNSTFVGCRNLKTVPQIPSSVNDMCNTFSGCVSLTGTITINANPTIYNDCFMGVNLQSNNITLIGSSIMLEKLKATANN